MVNSSTVAVPPGGSPGFLGQATAIEQSRAIAEVQAMVIVAQQCPRDLSRVVRQMQETCKQMPLAERAFYKFPRGGQTVQGPSVHLARELARCFGNIGYGVNELRRDDAAGTSEMQAYAWDLEANTRSAHIFIVPHMRDKRGGPERLVDLRDVYENNANNGARRLREAIYSVLPTWFVAEAEDRCRETLRSGGGKSMPQRVTDAVSLFEAIGVSVDRLESKVGRSTAKWNEHDIVQLGITYKSIQNGEIQIDDEFGSNRVTASEILASAPAKTAAQPATVTPEPMQDRQRKRMFVLFTEQNLTDRDQQLALIADVIGHEISSRGDLTSEQAGKVIAWLEAGPE